MASPPATLPVSSRSDRDCPRNSNEDLDQGRDLDLTASPPRAGPSGADPDFTPLIEQGQDFQDSKKRPREESIDIVAPEQPVAGPSNPGGELGERDNTLPKRQRVRQTDDSFGIEYAPSPPSYAEHLLFPEDGLSNQIAGPSSSSMSSQTMPMSSVDTNSFEEGSASMTALQAGSSSSMGSMSLANLLNPASQTPTPTPSLPPLSQPESIIAGSSQSQPPPTPISQLEPLSAYTCPICFSAPTYATMTPCGHVCCGECLFTAVKASIQRATHHVPPAERAKCPVCRAPIPGWDGRGGGVIGLKPRAKVSYAYGDEGASQ
ncbi:hypothetical protein NLI96_g4974 [Meripilus lineatus]|uniref:RING-type domain-containing protein n=1 Tax=Meripilus lineatus TaxID=2056292 RepID=A0AAD5YJE7_9APHY|nr:hypothetical protein NLI96_g4974 [Physisporinus lineatus]